MAAYTHAPSKRIIRPLEADRFSCASGPVKVLVRDGVRLEEPEYIDCTGAEPDLSPYTLSKKRKENNV